MKSTVFLKGRLLVLHQNLTHFVYRRVDSHWGYNTIFVVFNQWDPRIHPDIIRHIHLSIKRYGY